MSEKLRIKTFFNDEAHRLNVPYEKCFSYLVAKIKQVYRIRQGALAKMRLLYQDVDGDAITMWVTSREMGEFLERGACCSCLFCLLLANTHQVSSCLVCRQLGSRRASDEELVDAFDHTDNPEWLRVDITIDDDQPYEEAEEIEIPEVKEEEMKEEEQIDAEPLFFGSPQQCPQSDPNPIPALALSQTVQQMQTQVCSLSFFLFTFSLFFSLSFFSPLTLSLFRPLSLFLAFQLSF